MSAQPITVVAALKEEVPDWVWRNFDVVVTGPGKVNAASHLGLHLAHDSKQTSRVVNIGTAGRIDHDLPPFEPLEVGRIMEWDTDLTFIGELVHSDSHRWGKPMDLHSPSRIHLATGDSFIETGSEALDYLVASGVHIVDMEAYAFAKVCALHGVGFQCVKVISDDGDADDWKKNTEHCKSVLEKWAREHLTPIH